MKQQIARLSPHQNGKVFGVLMALTSLIFLIPFVLLFGAFGPGGRGAGPSMFMFILMPFIYLIFGYLSVAVGCMIYNFMFRYIGGVEFDAEASVG